MKKYIINHISLQLLYLILILILQITPSSQQVGNVYLNPSKSLNDGKYQEINREIETFVEEKAIKPTPNQQKLPSLINNNHIVNILIFSFFSLILLTLSFAIYYLYDIVCNSNIRRKTSKKNKFQTGNPFFNSLKKKKGGSRFRFLKNIHKTKAIISKLEEESDSFIGNNSGNCSLNLSLSSKNSENGSVDQSFSSSFVDDVKNKYCSMTSLDIIDENFEENLSVKSS